MNLDLPEDIMLALSASDGRIPDEEIIRRLLSEHQSKLPPGGSSVRAMRWALLPSEAGVLWGVDGPHLHGRQAPTQTARPVKGNRQRLHPERDPPGGTISLA